MYSPGLTSWRAQFDRLIRSHARVTQPYTSGVAYDDDLQHYFQDCWHLKDWIKNDPTSGVSAQIESEVLAHKALRIAADLANGSKHLARHTHREGAYVTSTNFTVHLGQNKPADIEYVVTLADETTVSAQSLVQETFQAWEEVLCKLGLNK